MQTQAQVNEYEITFVNWKNETESYCAIKKVNGQTYFPRCNKLGEASDTNRVFNRTEALEDNLRDIQLGWYKDILTNLEKKSQGIINLSTGSGKTIISIIVARKSGLKTLVLVNRISIKEQWEFEIKKLKCQEHLQVETIQYLISKKQAYDMTLFDCLIVDECHGYVSPIRSTWLTEQQQNFQIIIGLSATIDTVLPFAKFLFGNIIVSNIVRDLKQRSEIHVYKFNFKLESVFNKRYYNHQQNDVLDYSNLLAQLVYNKNRTDYISNLILKYLREDPDRNMLVISERLCQLEELYATLFPKIPGTVIVTSKKWKEEKNKINDSRLILGISSIVGQAFNVPHLNSVLFACPKKNIIQCIGRIYRKKHLTFPLIIDFIDDHYCFQNQFKKRMEVYKNKIDKPIFKTMMTTQKMRLDKYFS